MMRNFVCVLKQVGLWLGLACACGLSLATGSLPVRLVLTSQEQASLGVQVAPAQAYASEPVLANAVVVVPVGQAMALSAPYAGHVSRVWVGVGDVVKAGASLAQFTSPLLGEVRRQLIEAEQDYKNATASVLRDQALFDEGVIPALRLQLARSRQETAQSHWRAREAELQATGMQFESQAGYATGTVKAPMAGQVLEASVSLGQRVEAGTVLFKLANDSQLQLDLQLSTDKAAHLQVGDDVSIASRGAMARITGVSRAVSAGQSAYARAVVLQRGSLQVGEWVAVTVQARGKAQAVRPGTQWHIPSRALTPWRGQSWLFVANDKGFDAMPVKVLSATDDLSLIEATLPDRAKVAIAGVASLRAMLQKDE